MKLTEEQIAQYRDQGVVIAERVLTDADLQPAIDAIRGWIDRCASALHAEGKIEYLYDDEPFERRYARLYAQCDDFRNGMDVPQARLREIFEFLRNDDLLEAVECLIGPEISCSPIQHLRAKPPSRLTGGEEALNFVNVPWHQDAGVTLEEADPYEIVTCWIPLADATEENGCIQVIPGVVGLGLLEHIRDGNTMIRPDLLPDLAAQPAPVRKGGVIFMSKYTPHRSSPNRTDWTTRWSLDLRYQPAGTPTGRPCFPDFVARSRADPDSVLTDYDAWDRRWREAFESFARNPIKLHRV